MCKDVLDADASALKQKKLFLLDMDGTLYNEDSLFPETPAFLKAIRDSGGKYVFITNNSSKSVLRYVEKLRRLGIEAEAGDFYTSTLATGAYLLAHFPNQLVFCVGTRDFVSELRSLGVRCTEKIEDGIAAVVVGFDRELTYQKLRDASELLTRGLPFIAANPDRACPVSFGFEPDCGAICEALYFATNRRPLYIGKPEAAMVDYVVAHSPYTKAETLVVGDRLYTDIACGKKAQVDTVCVLSGEATLADIRAGEVQPTWVLDNIGSITDILLG